MYYIWRFNTPQNTYTYKIDCRKTIKVINTIISLYILFNIFWEKTTINFIIDFFVIIFCPVLKPFFI